MRVKLGPQRAVSQFVDDKLFNGKVKRGVFLKCSVVFLTIRLQDTTPIMRLGKVRVFRFKVYLADVGVDVGHC